MNLLCTLEQFDSRDDPDDIMLDRACDRLAEVRKAEQDAASTEIALADATASTEV